MKRLVYCLLLISFSVSALAQTKNQDQKLVEETIVKFFDAMSAYDFDKMRSYCTADMSFVEYGEVWSLDKLVNSMKPYANKGETRINTLVFLATAIKGNTASVIYDNTADFETKDKKKERVRWLESVMLVKEKGSWKMHLLHSTHLKDKRN